MNPIRYAFFGTPHFAVEVLEAMKPMLPALVVTAPDKPSGRGLELTPSAVKLWAKANDVPFIQPTSLTETPTELIDGKFDLFLVAAYGKILRKNILDLPRHKCINIHPSLLPKYRGASPIEAQILADEKEVGVSLIVMDEEVDHGPVIGQEKGDATITGKKEFSKMLAYAGGLLAARTLPQWVSGSITAVPQDHTQATFTKKIKKEDGLIDPHGNARKNYLKYLAYEGWPGVYFFENGLPGQGKRIKVTKAKFENNQFVIERVIPEGKPEMPYGRA
jgi:methionyl-tRNA formyltransferase